MEKGLDSPLKTRSCAGKGMQKVFFLNDFSTHFIRIARLLFSIEFTEILVNSMNFINFLIT